MGRARTKSKQHLPPRLLFRRGRYYYATPGSNRKEIALGSDYSLAMKRYAELAEEGPSINPVPAGAAARMFKSMRANAKARGIEVAITLADIEKMLAISLCRCAVTGIRFSGDRPEGQRIRPWLPSLDRIDSRSGYVAGNVRIVCAAANLAMNQFGEVVLFKMAAGMVMYRRIADHSEDIGPNAKNDDTDKPLISLVPGPGIEPGYPCG